MKRSILIAAVLVLLSSCTRKQKNDVVTRVKFHVQFDYGTNMFNADIFANYYDRYIMYEMPYHETGSIGEVTEYDRLKYTYLIYHADSAVGYEVKTLNDLFDKPVPLDAAIQERTLMKLDLADLLKALKVKAMVDTLEKGRYYFADSLYDSAHFYYDKRLKDIPATLSPALDASHRSKLTRVDLYSRVDPALKRPLINSWSLQIVPVEGEKELKAFFKRFERYILKLKIEG